MLVLSRRLGETIMIGEIAVKVVDLRPGKVRLGIDADPSVPVHRLEVYEAIHRDQDRPTDRPPPSPPG